jgi:MYXO-CTERM domain-containing protein
MDLARASAVWHEMFHLTQQLNQDVMKKITKLFVVLAFGMLCTFTVPSITKAQDNNATATRDDEDDDDTDWGWVGLIGLAGLLGLRGRDKRDVDERPRSTTTNPIR